MKAVNLLWVSKHDYFSFGYTTLGIEYGIEVKIYPVGAHYGHGKVERKIQDINDL